MVSVFIRVKKTSIKGVVYEKHVLVESVRINGSPRQRVIMELGKLDLPKSQWKKLAHALECQLSGQTSLLETQDRYIDELALSLASNARLSQKLAVQQTEDSDSKSLVTIDLHSISTEQSRTIGPELVCEKAWDLLQFDRVFRQAGFNRFDTAFAKVLIFGRLISPGSERHTIDWFRQRSALSELLHVDLLDCGKDRFYEMGDMIYDHKDILESLLFQRQQDLFPASAHTVYLYDLTNTYMEGACLGNQFAQYGHCKSKRFDCPIIALSLVVRNDGMPVASHIYKGNQSEPETMEDVLKRLSQLFGYDSAQLVLEKPTIVMDRGIATDDNIKRLKAGGYPYIVITRADQTEEYRSLFEKDRDSFTRIDDGKRSAYGETHCVYVKKVEPIVPDANQEAPIGDGSPLQPEHADPGISKVLCFSEGKARKENAIIGKKEQRFLERVNALDQSIQKGNILALDKVQKKLDTIAKKHKRFAEAYSLEIICGENGKATGVKAVPKEVTPDPLAGCYVIESTHTELNEVETWKLYMTLTHVENAFRSMKSELGMRPVYHQTADRCAAHLFITVLAYHILSLIERLLALKEDTRQWATLRDVLSTHMRNTVVMKDTDGNIYHHRVTGKPEDVHKNIYLKLGVDDPTKTITSSFK